MRNKNYLSDTRGGADGRVEREHKDPTTRVKPRNAPATYKKARNDPVWQTSDDCSLVEILHKNERKNAEQPLHDA